MFEHRFSAISPRARPASIDRVNLPAGSLREFDERRVVDADARRGEPVEHLVGEELELGQPVLSLLELAAIVAGVGGEGGKAALHAVDAGLDMAGRLGDAVGLAVDQSDDLGDVAHGVVDPGERALRDAALVDAGLDLGGDRLGLTGQRGDGAGYLAGRGAGVVASFFTSAATTAKRAPPRPPARSMVAFKGMLVLLAMASITRRRAGLESSPR